MRKSRKVEHIENYLKSEYTGDPLFKNVYLEHNALPDLGIEDISTSLTFLGKKMDFPLLINAITGGTSQAEDINESLAMIAREFGLAMAVGSQRIAFEDKAAEDSFKVVRSILCDCNPVIGNLGQETTLAEAQRAVDMIQADALQFHLNVAQELAMPEGDRDFKGVGDRMFAIAKELSVPLIAKEVGFGLSGPVCKKLQAGGISYVDLGGFGGTNFLEIEDLRSHESDYSDLYTWGVPTAKSIIDARKNFSGTIVASGGVKSALDIVKSIALGADLVAMSGELLKFLMYGGFEYTLQFVEGLIYQTKMIMVMLGAKDLDALRQTPYKIFGDLKNLCD